MKTLLPQSAEVLAKLPRSRNLARFKFPILLAVAAILLFSFAIPRAAAVQPLAPGDWIWFDGSSTIGTDCVSTYPCGQPGVYGTKGTLASGNIPGSRSDAMSWTDASGNKWLFGGFGYGAGGALGEMNDLWQSGTLGNEWGWISGSNGPGHSGVYGTLGTPTSTTVPGGRQDAMTWTDKSGNLWLFGGLGYDGSATSTYGYENDLWMYNPTTNQWTWESGSSTVPAPTSTIYGTLIGASPGVYGTLGTPASGNTPSGRTNATSWTDSSGNLWLFGGGVVDELGYEDVYNDLWEFNTTTKLWTWVSGGNTLDELGVYGAFQTPASGNAPGARYLASSWTDSTGNFWLFGGSGYASNAGELNLNDLWKFSPSTSQWTWMGGASILYPCNILFSTPCPVPGTYGTLGTAASTDFPGARNAATTWIDSSGNLWLFGGAGQDANNFGAWLNDLWEYNPGTTEWTWMGGSSTIPSSCTTGDCGQPGVYGSLGTAASTSVPGARQTAVSWTDQSGNLWLFGGWGVVANGATGYLNDMWEYQPPSASTTPLAATPTFSVQTGIYTTAQTVTINDSTSGSTIYYTTNDTTPTTSSPSLSPGGSITVSSSETVEAVAVASGYTNSDVATANYTISTPAATPTFSIPAGTYSSAQTVTINDTTSGATIYYTTNGTSPATSSSSLPPGGTITVSSSETLEALATASGYTTSAVATAAYTINLPAVTLSKTTALTFVSSAGTTSAPQTFTVTNSGAANLSITGITITGSNSNVFAQTNNCPSTLAPSALCTVSVTYTPTGVEDDAAYVSIADNAVSSPQTVELLGLGGAATGSGISISPAGPLRFSALASATSATQIITITSTGNTNLSINSVSIIGVNPADFAQTNNCSASIAASGLCQISVTFTPAAAQSYSASVSIADNASGSPQSVSLSGTGSATPLATQTQLSSNVNSVTLGTGVNLTATVSETAGNSIPSGTVTFYDGTASLGTALLFNNGTASFITNALAVGAHSITATYGGDTNNAGSTSAAAVVTVNTAATGSGEWTWLGGNQGGSLGLGVGPSPVYGTQGTPSTANLPGNRYGASTWTDSNGNLWLLGGYGYDSTGTNGYLNDLWEYSLTARTWTWVGGSNVVGANDSQFGVYGTLGTAAPGNMPGGREYAAAWTDNSGRLWLFGGFGSGAGPNASDLGFLNDLWMYNPSTNLWTWEGGATNPSTVAYTEVPGVYGTQGTPSTSNIPGARYNASFAVDSRGNFWLFGGVGGDSAGNQAGLNDLWMFNPSTGAWTWVSGSSVVLAAATNPGSGTPGLYGTKGTASSGSVPGSRQSSAAWMDLSGNLWLFGGAGEDSIGRSGELSDLWMFNAVNGEWTWEGGSNTVPVNGGNPGVYGTEGSASATNMPGSRYTDSAWTDTQGNLWLFGGQGFDSAGNFGALNDLWTYSPSANKWTWMDGSNLASQSGSYGTLGVASPSNTPGDRNSAAAWTDKSGNFWLYGGGAPAAVELLVYYYSDLWKYQLSAATTPVLTTPTVTVTPGSSSITTAQSLMVNIRVSGGSGNPTPTGSVTLSSGSYTSATTTLTSGSATITVPASSLATGTDTLTVSYTPDSSSSSTFNSATGTNSVTVTAQAKTTPTVTVTPSPTSITTAQALTVTIAVSGSGSTPTGSVTLTSGSYTSAATTLSGGSASITVPAGSLAAGTDTLTATYTPDSNSSGTFNTATGTNSVSVTSSITPVAPTVTVTPASSSITTAQSLSVTVTVTGSGPCAAAGQKLITALTIAPEVCANSSPTGTVILSSGSYTSVATTLSSGSATIVIPAGSLSTGTDTLAATYTPDSNSTGSFTSATGTSSLTVTAATVQITVGTSPTGLSFSVDGTPYTSPQTLSWTVGSSHTIATTSPQTNGGTQNTFTSWSDSGAISHSVTAPSTATSYTATFSTSYQLTTAASPSADGTVTPQSGTYYASGAVVNLTATPNSGYSFTSWTGSVAGPGSASTTVTMSAAQSVTANFSAVVVNAPVASLTPPSLSFTSTASVTSAAQVATLSNTGNATLTISGITITGANPTDFAVSTGANACGSSLAAGATCSIYVTFTPASATSFAATLSVADNAVGSPQTTTLTGTGTSPAVPSFVVSSTTTPQTIQPGGIATYSITAAAQNGTFPNSVTLAASGLPTGATATFSPTSITPGSSSATSTLTIQTAKPVTALNTKESPWPLAAPALALIGFFFVPGKRRRRWITVFVLLLASLGAFTALTACGGGFGMTASATSYNITITGTSGTVQQTTTVQLTVE